MTTTSNNRPSDPLHTSGPLTGEFANLNGAEAFGGVASPLGWTFFATSAELGMRRGCIDLGALDRSQARPPENPDQRFFNPFFGRPGSNILLLRSVMDRIWGSSGSGYDRSFFAKEGKPATSSKHRWSTFVAAYKFILVAIRSPFRLSRYRRELLSWWQASVRPDSTSSSNEALEKYREAVDYQRRVIRSHTHVSWVGQALLERLHKHCQAAGFPGLELELIASDEEFEEQGLISDLWAVSRDQQSLEQFLTVWGFHGPSEGELSSHSWREDSSPLLPIITAYRAKPDEQTPSTLKRRQNDTRKLAEDRLLKGQPLWYRIKLRFLISQARTYIPLRQVGRGTFLRTYDVARCMARRIGTEMTANGVLEGPEDIFYLAQSELLGALPEDVQSTVRFRRERRDYYKTIELPERWTGELTEDMVTVVQPEPSRPATTSEGPERIEGIGVSVGIVEGRAIVLNRPDGAYEDLSPGDILVCVTTDPSWAAIFYAVAGVVTDIGAQMSHGAIVARELGIPAVVNTRGASKRVRTGDHIRIDGTSGIVEILARTSDPVSL